MLSRERPFRTIVEMPRLERSLQCGDRFVFLGSCFAGYIGERFAEYGLPVLCNPLGVLFNPLSILAVVEGALHGSWDSWPLFQDREGFWHCWLASSILSADDEESFRRAANEAFTALHQALADSQWLFVTLGTNVCYRLKESGLVVANCHKMPSSLFEEVTLGVGECTDALLKIVALLRSCNPDLRVVFTVSPYRYAKYGFHGSQLSKATLLLSVDEVCRKHPEACTYLPVYEIFMDELRDYRFYAEDMIHPAPVAVDYVWNRLVEECMDTRLQTYLADYEPIRRALAHRPQDPDSPQYREFLRKTESKVQNLLASLTAS